MAATTSVLNLPSQPPYARESIAALTTAKGLTAATYNTTNTSASPYDAYSHTKRPEAALIQVKTSGGINWTIDSTTPTVGAVGFVNVVGDFIFLHSYASIAAFQCINTGAGDGATIEVCYFR